MGGGKDGKMFSNLAPSIVRKIKGCEGLTLSVLLDCTGSMGSEIEGCKKGALETISRFKTLAPVCATNFVGYCFNADDCVPSISTIAHGFG